MKAIKKTGLVPVTFVRSVLPYKAGETAGLAPEKAREHLDAGLVELMPIPPDVETIVYDLPVKAKAPAPAPKQEVIRSAVVITENWQEMHHLQRIKLATQILGVEKLDPPPEMKAADYANDIIRQELTNRGKAAGGADPASAGEGDPASETGKQTKGDPMESEGAQQT